MEFQRMHSPVRVLLSGRKTDLFVGPRAIKASETNEYQQPFINF